MELKTSSLKDFTIAGLWSSVIGKQISVQCDHAHWWIHGVYSVEVEPIPQSGNGIQEIWLYGESDFRFTLHWTNGIAEDGGVILKVSE